MTNDRYWNALSKSNQTLLLDAVSSTEKDKTITAKQTAKLIEGLATCKSTQTSGNLGLFFNQDMSNNNSLTPLAGILEHTKEPGKVLDHLVTIACGAAMKTHSGRSIHKLTTKLWTDFSGPEKEQANNVLEQIKAKTAILQDPYFEDYLKDFAKKKKDVNKDFNETDFDTFKEKKLSGITKSDFKKLLKIKTGITENHGVITGDDVLLILKYPTLLMGKNGVLTGEEKAQFKNKLTEIYNNVDIKEYPHLSYLLLNLPEGLITDKDQTKETALKDKYKDFTEHATNLATLEVARPKGMYFGYGFEFEVNGKNSSDNIRLKEDKVYIKIKHKIPGSSPKFNQGDYVCVGSVKDIENCLGINGLNDDKTITQEHLPKLSAYIRCKEDLTIHRCRGKEGINEQPVETLKKEDKTVFVEQKSMFGKSGYKAASELGEKEFTKQFAKNGNEIKFECEEFVVADAGAPADAATTNYKVTIRIGSKDIEFYTDQAAKDLPNLLTQVREGKAQIGIAPDSLSSEQYDKIKKPIINDIEGLLSGTDQKKKPSTSTKPTGCSIFGRCFGKSH